MRSTLFWLTLAAALAVNAAGCVATSRTSPRLTANPTVEATPAASGMDRETRQLLDNMRAALANHDMRMYHQFRTSLTKLVGQEQLSAADRNYRQMLANLRAATAAHDGRARATFTAQLRALCGPATLTGAIEFCEKDLAAATE
jgi:hypothetical protein